MPKQVDRLFHKLLFLIPIGIIGNVLFSLATTKQEVLASVLHFSPAYFALAMLFSIVPWFTGSLRLLLWSRFLGKSMDYPAVLKISIGAELGAAVSPPLIGGSAVKIGMLMRRGFSGGTALSLSVLENMEDTIFFLVMVPLALTVSSAWNLPQVRSLQAGLGNPAVWTLLGGAGICIGVILLVIIRISKNGMTWTAGLVRLREKVRSFYYNFTATYQRISREGKSTFALTMTLTSIQWICRYSIISLLLASMGVPVRPVLFMVLQVFVFALMTLVPTPGAVGGAEVMFSLMYSAFLPAGTIGLVTTGWRFLTFYFLLLLAAALFLLFGMQPEAATRPAGEQGVVPSE